MLAGNFSTENAPGSPLHALSRQIVTFHEDLDLRAFGSRPAVPEGCSGKAG